VKPFAVVAQHGADEHRPVAVGLVADRTAIDHARAVGDTKIWGGDLPEKARRVAAPFASATFNYNPAGHPPGPYLTEHFDAHFFSFFDVQEMLDLTPFPCISPKTPVPEVYPEGYTTEPVHIPAMGAHIIPDNVETLDDFETVMIYGNLGSHVHMLEPMFPVSSLRAFQDKGQCFPIPQPARAPWSGWFPRVYCYEEYEHRGLAITLQDFHFYKRYQVVKGQSHARSDASEDSVSTTSSSTSSIDTSDSSIFSFSKSSSYTSSETVSSSISSTSTKTARELFNPTFGLPSDCADLMMGPPGPGPEIPPR
jgi:hypothetical protein